MIISPPTSCSFPIAPPKSSSVPDSPSFAFTFEAFPALPALPLVFDVVAVLPAAGLCGGGNNDANDDDGGGCCFDPATLLRFGALSSLSSISSSSSVVSIVSGSDSSSTSFLVPALAPRVGALRVFGVTGACVGGATLRFGGIVRYGGGWRGSACSDDNLYRVYRGV